MTRIRSLPSVSLTTTAQKIIAATDGVGDAGIPRQGIALLNPLTVPPAAPVTIGIALFDVADAADATTALADPYAYVAPGGTFELDSPEGIEVWAFTTSGTVNVRPKIYADVRKGA